MYAGGPLHPRGKRPYDYVSKSPGAESHHPPAKVGHSARHEPLPASKDVVKPKSKTVKLSSAKAANLVGVFFFISFFSRIFCRMLSSVTLLYSS